jgi:cysteine-rich repeat protein
VRLHGGSSGTAPLFRVDASDGTVESLGDVPALWDSYRSPQMVRAGSIAAYVGATEVRFLDLGPLCGNGAMDTGETCDDGNNLDGDGCSAGCLTELP